MTKITVSFLTDQVEATDDAARRFVTDLSRQARDYGVGVDALTFVSAEVPPATRSVTAADLIAAGVNADVANAIVNA